MKMKKVFVLGLTVLILSFGFISCDTGSGGGGDEIPVEFRGTYTNSSGGTHTLVVRATDATLTRSGFSPVTKPFRNSTEDGSNISASFYSGSWSESVEQFIIIVDTSSGNITAVSYRPAGGQFASVGSGFWTKQQ